MAKKKKKSPSEVRATLKWLNKQRSMAASVHDELRRQREQQEWEQRKAKND